MEWAYCPYQFQSETERHTWCTHCTFRRQNSLLSFTYPEGLPCERWTSRSSLQSEGPALIMDNDLLYEDRVGLTRTTHQVGPAYLAPPL